MGHIRESTLTIDKASADFPEKIQELWDAGIAVRVEKSDAVTVYCDSVNSLRTAEQIVRGDDEPDGEEVVITPDDVGTIDAADIVG